jgi:cysteine desulfuration protein SufE
MTKNIQKKVDAIKKIFLPLSQEEKYAAVIKFGQELPSLKEEDKTAQNLVAGCQSILYLQTTSKDGKLYFTAHADALISAGLAALLISVYSGETPEVILTYKPDFLAEIGIASSLSLNRSNGLANIHLRIKKDALSALMSQQKSVEK